MERTYGRTVWVFVIINGLSYVLVGSTVVNTRAKSKAQEAAAATASPPQYDEGSNKAESDGDNPPADNEEEGNDNAEEGNDDVEELGDDDIEADESGDKESVAEKPNEQVGASEPATTPEE
ncbi:hypothetical protein HAX54_038130, partial [Datura stramonium]|nr:hypothetical protein [Datura stramonium]